MRGSPSAAELLVLVSALSLCSLFLTYQLALPSSARPPIASHVLLQVQQDVNQGRPAVALASNERRLHQLLRTLERQQQGNEILTRRIGLVRGLSHLVARDLPVITAALASIAFDVANFTNSNTTRDDWSLLMCQSLYDSDCQLTNTYASLRRDQRVNHIPGVRLALGLRSSLCSIQTRLAHFGLNQQYQHTEPFCFTLPQQYEELLNAVDSSSFNTTWFLKSIKNGTRPEILTTAEIFRRARSKQLPGNVEAVLQQAVESQLRVLGLPISLQVFVLVSSVAPLRAYVHSQGFVHFRHDETRSFKKIPGKTWLLSQLWRHLAESEGLTSVRKAREALDFAILRVLVAAEPAILTSLAELQHKPPAARYRSQQSFQLLRMGVILNAALQPTILEIDPLPALHDIATDFVGAGVPFTVLRDTFRLIFASDVVHNDVMEALQAVASQDTGILGINCLISNELCLTQEDLLYLLSTRRESLSIGEFRRFYPAVPSEPKAPPVYASLLEKLQKELETSSTICTLLRDTLRHTTADMDQLLTNMERFFSSQETDDEEYVYQTEPRIKYASFNLQSLTLVRSGISHSQISSQETGKIRKKPPGCSDDPSNAAYLRELHIEPVVRLSPSFSPLWSEYRAEVDFMVTSLRISASAMSCSISVHFDDREIGEHLQSSAYNATLGLGENRINVQLFATNDLAKEETSNSAINVYSITIVRREATSPGHFQPSMQHHVCSLRQECKFRFSPNESCGLHSEWDQLDWTRVTERHSKLPHCDSGQAFGRWILPCENCNNRSSCWWHLAKWQPYSCTHYTLDQIQLRQCLEGKKVLFLGDSTIRGVMHYILERLNGSLSAKDKTHSLRTYSGLNSGRTALSFAYYPQFWLRAPQRPVFAKTLYRLLLKSQPLRNTTDTVIVVGGVHWLATHHLHTLLRAVRREGLQGARLVVKTLGSGFHIPADGVHLLSKRQQEKLLLHSQGLVAFAQHYHMDVVDTFNMTAARYLDFLPGKCACHFHKISDNGNAGYRVEGPINAIYSEILLSRMCPLK